MLNEQILLFFFFYFFFQFNFDFMLCFILDFEESQTS
jgi:hypothetical protein